jgi:TonB family protein
MKLALSLSLMLLVSIGVAKAAQDSPQSAADTGLNKNAVKPVSGSASENDDAVCMLEVFTDTQGVDFGSYLADVLESVRQHWYALIPAEAQRPEQKAGKVSIEFVILKNGQVAGMKIIGPSGEIPLDRAAWGGIVASAPFAPLPDGFHGPYLGLRFHFLYNPGKMQKPAAKPDQK